jgi:hypothetical protein
MQTVYARYEVGFNGQCLEYFASFFAASERAVTIGGYVYDRMAHIGRPQLWQSFGSDLLVTLVRVL